MSQDEYDTETHHARSTTPIEFETVEHTTKITACCEKEPEWVYGGDQRCPKCDRWNPRTVKRVTVERRRVNAD